MKKFITLLLAFAMVFSLVACGDKAEVPSDDQTGTEQTGTPEMIPLNMAASDIGGEYYINGALFNTIWEENIPGVVTAIQPGGSTSNIKTCANGECELAWTHSAVVDLAAQGVDPFDEVYDGVSQILATHPAAMQCVVIRGSKLTSLSQIEDKKIGLNTPGSLGNVIAMDLLESEYGITEESIQKAGGTISYLAKSEAGDALRDGQIDLWMFMGPYPDTVLSDLIFNPGLEFIDIESDKLEHFLSQHPAYSSLTIPAGAYDGIAEDHDVVCSWNVLVARDDMDEELVYQMTKLVWENIETVYAGSVTAKRCMSIDNPCPGWEATGIHPGAKRYYEEIGLKFE